MLRTDSIYLVTPDLDRAIRFYSVIFDRAPTAVIPWTADGSQRGAFFDLPDGLHFIISQEAGFSTALQAIASSRSPFFMGFQVSDVQYEYTRLKISGLEVGEPPVKHPSGALAFEFHDPDGNGLRIGEAWKTPSVPPGTI